MYNKLKQPPYQNWFWRRQGIDSGNGVFSGDPAELSPTEHYKDGSYTLKLWYDSLRPARQWNLGAVDADFTKITKNSLECMESNGSAFLHSDLTGADKPSSTIVETSDGWTIYIVGRWDGTLNDTIAMINGVTFESRIRFKVDGSGKIFAELYDGTVQILGYSPVLSAGQWFSIGITITHATGAGKIVFMQEDAVEDTEVGWTPFTCDGVTSTSRLYSNDTTTEKWDGAMAELIIFQDAHTVEQMKAINAFNASKWDIT